MTKRVPVNDFIDAANEINYLHHKISQLERSYTEHRESYQRLRQRVTNAERKIQDLRTELAQGRCPSCGHEWNMHQPEGCWFTVDRGHPSQNLVCPCNMPRRTDAS